MTDTIGELQWKRIEDVVIGQVTSIFYKPNEDLIIINEERNGDTIKQIFGSHAPGLPELIDALEKFCVAKHEEKMELFKTIRNRMK